MHNRLVSRFAKRVFLAAFLVVTASSASYALFVAPQDVQVSYVRAEGAYDGEAWDRCVNHRAVSDGIVAPSNPPAGYGLTVRGHFGKWQVKRCLRQIPTAYLH